MLNTLSLLLMSLLPGHAPEDDPVGDGLGDAQITAAVERELDNDVAVEDDIDVVTRRGVVTLTGTAEHLLEKERATRIAETVKGVRAVVDRVQLDLDEPTRSDEIIAADVQQALLRDPATDSYEVSVESRDGHVVLTGLVDSWTEKQLCGVVAKGVRGVEAVSNELAVSFPATRASEEIRSDIERSLHWNVLVDDALIDVRVDGDAVTLAGVVGSAAERRQALLACWVGGVKTVDAADLLVERWARDEDLREDKYVQRTDEEVRQALVEALAVDPRVASFHVAPSAHEGSITLQGVVDNLEAKRAAERDARNTVGVRYVHNLLKVRPAEERSDEAIAADVRAALASDPWVDRYEVDVQASDGEVRLDGTVDSTFERARADDLAARVNGVTDVRNALLVERPHPLVADPYVDEWTPRDYGWVEIEPRYSVVGDQEIAQDIEDEMFWSPYVDADAVDVEVSDGVATLTGQVDSWMERGAAQDNAYDAGATYVRNRLTVPVNGGGTGASE